MVLGVPAGVLIVTWMSFLSLVVTVFCSVLLVVFTLCALVAFGALAALKQPSLSHLFSLSFVLHFVIS
jgi:hypothetical protein